MAKLIFTSHYMKHALPAHLQHYVKYIATREGVDQIDNTKELQISFQKAADQNTERDKNEQALPASS